MQFSYAAAILQLTKICRGGVDDTVPSTPVEPGTNEDEILPLVLNFGTSAMTKALVEDTVLPTGSSVGITIRDDYGRYTGDDYTNIRYSSALSAGVQVWETTSPVLLARETGTLFSYWPHSEDEADGQVIDVTATSENQTDYMWGLPVAVSKSNRTASITMQHALSAVRIYCKRGSYTGAGEITGVAFGGDCAATAGILDLTCGALDDLSGQGTMIAPAITAKTITDSYQKVSDIIVVPASGTNGKVVVTLDGTDYEVEYENINLKQGEITKFFLTANDGDLSLTDITVSEWTYGDSVDGEILINDKVRIVGNIKNIAFNNVVSDNGTVTIKAIPTVDIASFAEVAPVTFTGDAILTQSSDINTGIRTITISDIASDIVVTFDGVVENNTEDYDLIAVFDVEAGKSVEIIGSAYVGSNYPYKYLESATYRGVHLNIISNETRNYTFTVSGKHTLTYTFINSEIPEYAFYSCDYLYSVEFKTEITTIQSSSFIHSGIRQIIIPESVESIKDRAFYCAYYLQEISLPKNLITIEECAFFSCKALSSISLPPNITTIGDGGFKYCTNLKAITSQAAVAPTLGTDVFKDMPDNGILTVPAGADYSTWMSNDNLGGKNWTIAYMDE